MSKGKRVIGSNADAEPDSNVDADVELDSEGFRQIARIHTLSESPVGRPYDIICLRRSRYIMLRHQFATKNERESWLLL